ncbi:MAG TPA: cell division protein SepF [Acidimicrobiia bacterium]|nr:cell division protein SepF [Acidimicrobiia bacterium]
MPSLFSKALVYLGLVDEDPEDDPVINDDDRGARGQLQRRSPAHNRTDDWEDSDYRPDQRRMETRRPDMRRSETFSRVEGRRVEPPSSASRTTAFRSENVDSPVVRAVRPVDVQADILVVEEFGDAKVLADRVRDRVPVVLDLRRTQPDLVRRVIDFGSGLIYALDGTMNKIGDGLVVVLPPRVVLSRDERRRLQRLGVYELDDED